MYTVYIIELKGTRLSEYKGTQYVGDMITGEVITEMVPTPDKDKAMKYSSEGGANEDARFLARGGHKVKVILVTSEN